MQVRLLAAGMVTLGLGGIGIGAPACVFTTASDVGGLSTTVCTFRGMDSACGQCVSTACQSEVAAVCVAAGRGSEAESEVLNHLDGCAGDSDTAQCAGLTYIDDNPPNTGTENLVACLDEECAAECNIPRPTCSYSISSESTCGACLIGSCTSSIIGCCGVCSETFSYLDCVALNLTTCADQPTGNTQADAALLNCAARCSTACTM